MKTDQHSGNNRRQFLGKLAMGVAGVGVLANSSLSKQAAPVLTTESGFKYCLNTSTIRRQKLGIVGEVELAAKVGYNSIEPWVRDVQTYKENGGLLKDLKRRINDLGLTVESATAFSKWIVDDPEQR